MSYDTIRPDDALYIDTACVDRFLSQETNYLCPVNVEHNERATVGYVHFFQNTRKGVFCLGEIVSRTFLHVMNRAALRSQVVQNDPVIANGLQHDPLLEYLSMCFPALSLSNYRNSDHPSYFRHVAICGVGKRRGTLSVYGRNADWIISRFKDLSHELLPRSLTLLNLEEDPFNEDLTFLFASITDAAYIKSKANLLKIDKAIANLDRTYVKASMNPVNGTSTTSDGVFLSKEMFLTLLRQNLDCIPKGYSMYPVYDPRIFQPIRALPPAEFQEYGEPAFKRKRLEFPPLPSEPVHVAPDTNSADDELTPKDKQGITISDLATMIGELRQDFNTLKNKIPCSDIESGEKKIKPSGSNTDTSLTKEDSTTVDASYGFIAKNGKSNTAENAKANKKLFVNALSKID